MSQGSTTMPPEEAADIAWDRYAKAAQDLKDVWDRPGASMLEKRVLHERALDTHRRFEAAYRMLSEPTPQSMEHERNRLACEGVLLISAFAAFAGLIAPDFHGVADLTALPLGAWLFSFSGRFATHIMRRA